MTQNRDRTPREGDDTDEGRVQKPVEPSEAGTDHEPPEDPDRPTDDVWKGNTLVEPAPGD